MDVLQNIQPVFKTFKVRQSEDRLRNYHYGHLTAKGNMAACMGFWNRERTIIKNC